MSEVPAKKVLVAVADGSEEIETVCIVDTLRRAGLEVTLAAIQNKEIVASRGVKLVADTVLQDCLENTYDLVVLPGGLKGAENFRDCPELISLVRQQKQSGRWYAAICAAPAVVLKTHDLLNQHFTCHPAFLADDPSNTKKRVEISGNCVTSQAPGTAIEFAVKLIELLCGVDKAEQVAAPMLVG